MATITSTGIGSGLDVNAIVTELMALEARPLNLLENAEASLNTQVSAIGQLQSRISSLRDTANALTSLTLWGQTVATSQNAAAVKVSTASGAAAGNYAVHATALAAAQTTASRAFTSADDVLNAGTLTIELGSWTGEPTPSGFTPKSGSSAVAIEIGADDSLSAIRDKINAAGAGVTASIVTDANGARLALRSTETGAENAFKVSVSETADDGVASDGLSALAFDAAGASQMTRTQTAANAAATINGISVSSASNTLEGVLDGLTITLLQTTTSAVEVSVAPDTEAIKTNINSFVSAFNDAARYIRDQTAYNADSKTGGTLQGDHLVNSLQSQLRNIMNQSSSASGVFSQMSDIGIAFKSDGTLTVNSSKLSNALGNLPELKKLLTTDGADTASSGFIDRFKDLANAVLGSEGAFESRNSSLKNQLSANAKSQEAMETRLTQTEARLRRQYQALDASMSQLNGLSTYMTQQLAMLNNNAS